MSEMRIDRAMERIGDLESLLREVLYFLENDNDGDGEFGNPAPMMMFYRVQEILNKSTAAKPAKGE